MIRGWEQMLEQVAMTFNRIPLDKIFESGGLRTVESPPANGHQLIWIY